MSLEEILPSIISFVTTVVGSGPWGWAITGVITAVFGFLFWWYRDEMLKAIQKATEKKRQKEQAENPVENTEAEEDAQKSEQEIEEIINNGDN